MSIAYAVLAIPFLAFSVVVIFDIGSWSSVKDAISVPWRLTLGVLWLATGCALLVAAALHKVTFLVWAPAVAGAVVFVYCLNRSRQETR